MSVGKSHRGIFGEDGTKETELSGHHEFSLVTQCRSVIKRHTVQVFKVDC